MDTTHCKTQSSPLESIEGVDWSAIDALMKTSVLPKNAITVRMIMERYECSLSTAKRRLLQMAKDGWECHKYNNGNTIASYIVPRVK